MSLDAWRTRVKLSLLHRVFTVCLNTSSVTLPKFGNRTLRNLRNAAHTRTPAEQHAGYCKRTFSGEHTLLSCTRRKGNHEL